MARRKLGELLIEAQVIDLMQLQSALGEQKKWGRPLGQTLVELGFISEGALVRALGNQLNIPAVELEGETASPEALMLLDYEFCQQHACFPFNYEERGQFLDVAMADPTNPELFDLIRVRTRCNIRPHLAGHRAIETAIRRDYLGEAPAVEVSIDNRPWLSRSEDLPHDGHLVDPAARPDDLPEEVQPRKRPPTSERPPLASGARDQLLMQLHETVRQLVANLERDEKVLRKLMALMVEKGLCTRAELVAKIYED